MSRALNLYIKVIRPAIRAKMDQKKKREYLNKLKRGE